MAYPIKLTGDSTKNVELQDKVLNIYSEERDKIVGRVFNGTFDYELYVFQNSKIRGLWDLPGLYLIVNKKRQKFLIGYTENLSSRRVHYFTLLSKIPYAIELQPNIRKELLAGQTVKEDFYFVPIIGITKVANVREFLKQIEDKLLRAIPESQQDMYYNIQKTRAAAKTTNLPKPVCFRDYVFKSQRHAARYFGFSDPYIRNRVSEGILKHYDPKNLTFAARQPPDGTVPSEQKLKEELIEEFKNCVSGIHPIKQNVNVIQGVKKYPIFLGPFKQNSVIFDPKLKAERLEEKPLVEKNIKLIETLFVEMDKNELVFQNYPMTGDGSGKLSERMGWYVIANKKNKKLYIGYSSNLLQRRSKHANSIGKVDRALNSIILADLNSGHTLEDFFFIDYCALPESVLELESFKFIQVLLHNTEVDVVNFFLGDSRYKHRIYNSRAGKKKPYPKKTS